MERAYVPACVCPTKMTTTMANAIHLKNLIIWISAQRFEYSRIFTICNETAVRNRIFIAIESWRLHNWNESFILSLEMWLYVKVCAHFLAYVYARFVSNNKSWMNPLVHPPLSIAMPTFPPIHRKGWIERKRQSMKWLIACYIIVSHILKCGASNARTACEIIISFDNLYF